MTVEKSIKKIIKHHLPDFVRSDHPKLVQFLEAYYDFLESEGQALHLNKNLLNYQDVDKTNETFLRLFRKEYIKRFPQNLYQDPLDPNRIVDVRNVIKNIREFYLAKGTEKSYEYLFRVLLDADIDFYYPRVDMLRASDGKWIQQVTIRSRRLQGDPFQFVSKRIVGEISNSSAFVESVIKINVGTYEIWELFLNRNSITGNFIVDENVTALDQPDTVVRIHPIITGVNITNGGEGYNKGDLINFTTTGPGVGGLAEVSLVGDNGEIKKAAIIDPGAGFFSGTTTAIFETKTNTATGTAIIGPQVKYPGYYLNDDGQLNEQNFIQDSFFYQQFSYVIKVSESIDRYRFFVNELLHPAGLLLFGNFISENVLDVSPKINENAACAQIELQISNKTTTPIYTDDSPLSATTIIEKEIVVDQTNPDVAGEAIVSFGSYKLGARLQSIDRDKLKYKPKGGSEETKMVGANAGYWSTDHANYQIKDFFHIRIEDMLNRPWVRTNIMPEPTLKNVD